MLKEISPLEASRGLSGFKVLATPGKIRVVRHSPLKKKFGGDKRAEKDDHENSRLLQLILMLGHWLERTDKQGLIRDVLLTEKYRNVRHGNRWHREAIFDGPYDNELGRLNSLNDRWSHGMLLGDLVASEVSWLRDELIDRQRELADHLKGKGDRTEERQSNFRQESTNPIWKDDIYIGLLPPSSPLDRPGEFPTKPERRRAGFTVKARDTLYAAGVVTEIEWGKNAVLVTLTLPGTSPEAYQLLADSSGVIMSRIWDRVSVHCKRKLKRKPTLGWFYVWEKQARGALHVHACLAASPEDFNIDELVSIGNLMTNCWAETLRKIGDENGVNMFYNAETDIDWSDRPDVWQLDVMPVKYSVARYLSKYVSKNAASERGSTFKGDDDGFPTPKRWWGRNQVISELIKKWSWEYQIDCANPLDIPLNEMVHESLQVYGGGCHTDCHTDLYKGIDKAKTDFWEVVKKVKIYTGKSVIKVNRTICNGITSTYLYSPQNYVEVFPQLTEMRSVFDSLAESSSERMIPWNERQSIEKEVEKPFLKWDKDLLRGIDPTDGNTIWDFERYFQYEDWKLMQDPWWHNETWRLINEETEWYVKVWSSYLDELRDMNKQNEYEYRFGNQGKAREIGLWEEVAAQTSIHEMMMDYLRESGLYSK